MSWTRTLQPKTGGDPPPETAVLNGPARPDWLPEPTRLQECLHERHAGLRDRMIFALAEPGLEPYRRWARRMAGCGASARFYVSPDVGKVKPWLARCKHRLCPFCSRARTANTTDQLASVVSVMTRPRLVVLTVKSSGADLRDQLRHLRTWFARLRTRKLWKGSVRGGAYTVECTLNKKNGRWHPHLHIIYDGTYLPQKQLAAAWHKITGLSEIVWISEVTDRDGAARELCKYIGKPAGAVEWSTMRIRDFARATNGARMIHTFGTYHGSKVEDKDKSEDLGKDTFSIGIGRLVYLAGLGLETPQRLLLLIAERWTAFSSYVYHELPQLCPPDRQVDKTRALMQLIRDQSPTSTRAPPAAGSTEKLDARIFLLFTRYRQEDQSGAFQAAINGNIRW